MYIIEKLIKIYFKLQKKEQINTAPQDDGNVELEDVITCRHNFMPVDSTGEILACSKCGYLIKKKRLKKKNN